MDYILDIAIPQNELKKIRLQERLIEWGEHLYSCTPRQYVTSSNIIFEEVENVQYYYKIFGKTFYNDMIILTLKDDSLSKLEYLVNSDMDMITENELLIFLEELFILKNFYILLVREDENVKRKFEIREKKDIVIDVCASLKWTNPNDILLVKE